MHKTQGLYAVSKPFSCLNGGKMSSICHLTILLWLW